MAHQQRYTTLIFAENTDDVPQRPYAPVTHYKGMVVCGSNNPNPALVLVEWNNSGMPRIWNYSWCGPNSCMPPVPKAGLLTRAHFPITCGMGWLWLATTTTSNRPNLPLNLIVVPNQSIAPLHLSCVTSHWRRLLWKAAPLPPLQKVHIQPPPPSLAPPRRRVQGLHLEVPFPTQISSDCKFIIVLGACARIASCAWF